MTTPKKASSCKGCNESVAHTFKQIEKGKTTCIGMCNQCPLKKQLLDQAVESPTCSRCNTSLHQIETTKKLGCIDCIHHFKDACHTVLKSLNVSEFSPEISAQHINIQELQASLQEAIAKELFEEAALLRDQLKQCTTIQEGL